MSIRLRIALLTGLGLAIAVGLTSAYLVQEMQQIHRIDIREHIVSMAEYIGKIVKYNLETNNVAALTRQAELPIGAGIISVHFTNERGEVIADTGDESHDEIVETAKRSLVTRSPYVGPIGMVTNGAVPVIGSDGELLGAVVLEVDTEASQMTLSMAQTTGIAAAVGGSLVGLGVAYLLAAFITLPLLNLVRGIRRFATGDYESRVTPPSSPELKEMAEAYNSMAVEIKRRLRNLEMLNRMAVDVSMARRISAVVETVRATCATAVDAEARMWVFNIYGDKLTSVAVPGLPSLIAEPDSLVVRAARESRVITIGEDPSDFPSGSNITPSQPPVNAAVVVPLISPDGTTGVLSAVSLSGSPRISHEDISFTVVLASIAGPAVAAILRQESQARSARTLQRVLVPSPPTSIPGVTVAARYRPAEEMARLGGDYYDFIQLSSSDWCFVVGDVSGKGLPAAQYATMAKYVVRSYILEYHSLLSALPLVNSALLLQTGAERFTTLFCAIFETRNRKLRFARAGHPPPLLYRGTAGQLHELRSTGPPVGVLDDPRFEEMEETLTPGDTLLIFTDGLTDARSGNERYGDHRLSLCFLEHARLAANQIADAMLEDVTEFSEGKLTDDLAVVVLRIE